MFTPDVLTRAVCVTIGAVASLQAQTPAAPAAWLQLRGDATNAGSLPGALSVSWFYKAPHTVRGLSVADGIVVVGTESEHGEADGQTPESDGTIAALDVRTGAPRWSRTLPSWVHGDPAIVRGEVVAALGRFPFDSTGAVVAFAAADGALRWRFTTHHAVMPAPAVDTVRGSVTVDGADSTAYVLDLATGRLRRSIRLHDLNAMSSPRVDGDGTVFVGVDASLVALDVARGTTRWRLARPPLNTLGEPPPALGAGLVFITGVQGLGFRDAYKRTDIAEIITLAAHALRTEPWRAHRSWFREHWLLAVDARGGALLWSRPLGVGFKVERNQSGTPVLSGDRVIVSSPISHEVSAFDARSGRPLWTRRLRAVHKGAVTVVGDDVLLGDDEGFLNLLSARDGALIGRCDAGAPFTVLAPVVVGQTLFTATKGGWVFARPYARVRATMRSDGRQRCFAR